MSNPFRTKGSIFSSLSRNDPIRESTWFHSKKPLQNYFNFFRQRSSLGTEDFLDIFPGFGILYGPLYLTPSPSSSFPIFRTLFTPRPTHIAPIESRGLACLLLDNTFDSRTSGLRLSPPLPPRKNANIPDRIIIALSFILLCVLDIIPWSAS